MSARVKFSGGRELAQRIRLLERRTQGDTLVQAVRKAAAPIVERASSLAPRRTGKLASEIVVRIRRGRRRVVAHADIGPSKEAWYGKFAEFGAGPHDITAQSGAALASDDQVFGATVFHPGNRQQPFLRPAMDEEEARTIDELGTQLKILLGIL